MNKTRPLRAAILTFENLPGFITEEIPNMNELIEDDLLIISAFKKLGHFAASVKWSEPGIDWNEFDIALIRSTWDYIDRSEEFLKVLSEIESSSCTLFNSLEAVKWNSDKHYLFDLMKWNIPVVPTFKSDGDIDDIVKSFEIKNFRTAVLKPSVGVGASDITRVDRNDIKEKVEALKNTHPHQIYFIQPLIESVMTEGEWSYVFIDGKLSHVLLKKPAAGDYRVQEMYGGTFEPADPYRRDLLQAGDILNKLPFANLYARLDLVRIEGVLSVMEVELIEPVLYFGLAPEGANKLVDAAVKKVYSIFSEINH